MLFGQARFFDGIQLVVFARPITKGPTVYVKRTYKDIPCGKEIKRHIKKHGVKIHGFNVIRRDWIQQNKI